MPQSSLLHRAKLGNPDAIAALISLALEARGVTTQVVLIQDCLHVSFRARRLLNQETLIAFTCQGLKKLECVGIHTVRVYGLRAAEELPVWTQTIDLNSLHESGEACELSAPDSDSESSDLEPSEPLATEREASEAADAMGPQFLARKAQLEIQALLSNASAALQTSDLSFEHRSILWVTGLAFLSGGFVAAFAKLNAERSLNGLIHSSRSTAAISNQSASASDQTGLLAKQYQDAKQFLQTMNAAQQAFYSEKQRFAASLEELERSISTEPTVKQAGPISFLSHAYTYKLTVADDQSQTQLTAIAKQAGLKSFTAIVVSDPALGSTSAIVCETALPSRLPPASPQRASGGIQCATGSTKLY